MLRINAGNLIVDYHETGMGLPVIFVPGITEFAGAFQFQFQGLQNSYRLISYNLRQGLKRPGEYTLDLLADDLRRFIEEVDLSGAVICGHSFGGLVALKFALRYPEMTRALVLISGFAAPPPDTSDRFLASISAAGHPFHRSLGARFKLHMARLLSGGSPHALTMEYAMSAVRTIARQAEKTNQTTIDQRMRIIRTSDFRASLPEILAPSLIVVGAKDRPFFLSSAQEMYEGIPDASLEVLEDGGHFCFLTRHDQFNAALDDFLKERLARIS